MAPPATYLLGQPNISDPFGRAIMSSDLVRGLQSINPLIQAWEQHTPGVWYPGRARGISTLWLGDPGGANRKITGFAYGAIPEFTQLGPHGDIITKGWRAIFQKVVRCKAASRKAIEIRFRVNLSLGDKDTVYCGRCRRDGQFVKSENMSGLCNLHDAVQKDVLRFQERKARMREQWRKLV